MDKTSWTLTFLIENQEEHWKLRCFGFIFFSLAFNLLAVCFQCVTWKWSRKLCMCQGKPWFVPQLCTAWFCVCVGTKCCIDREVILWYSQYQSYTSLLTATLPEHGEGKSWKEGCSPLLPVLQSGFVYEISELPNLGKSRAVVRGGVLLPVRPWEKCSTHHQGLLVPTDPALKEGWIAWEL